jgi:hypothetical protein
MKERGLGIRKSKYRMKVRKSMNKGVRVVIKRD